MPPRLRNAASYRGVRTRPAGTFYAETRSGNERISLGTLSTAHEAARAYDATAWQLGRPRSQMNFQDARNARQMWMRLLIAARDERVVAEWRARHPDEAAADAEFWATREAERAEKRAKRAADRAERRAAAEAQLHGVTTWDDNNPRWDDLGNDTSPKTSSFF
ncbi:unnamed protein product [Alopecurus aequalis]